MESTTTADLGSSHRLDHVGSIILQVGSDWRFDSIPRTGKKHNWRSITTPHAGPYTSANQDGIQKKAMSKGTTSSRLPDLFLQVPYQFEGFMQFQWGKPRYFIDTVRNINNVFPS